MERVQQRAAWLAILGAVALFAVWGLELISNEIPFGWPIVPAWARALQGPLLIAIIVGVPAGVCIGWIKGFPRWSYPYVAQSVLIGLYMMNTATPGFLFGRKVWGWRAWIPLGIAILVALLVTRSGQPMRQFFANIRTDWTRLSFGLFGCLPPVILAVFDEMDRLYSLYFMVILSGLLVGTALLHVTGPTHTEKRNALLVGTCLTIILTMGGPAAYWFNRGGSNVTAAIVAGIVIFLLIFSPALIGLARRPKPSSP